MDQELPQLTPEEAEILGQLLASDAPLADVARDRAISLIDAVRILARPHCRKYIEAARDAARRRFEALAADHAAAALRTLHDIAESKEIPPDDQPGAWDEEPATTRDRIAWQIERRRAATTIIRAATAHKRVPRTARNRAARDATPPRETPSVPGARPASPHEPLPRQESATTCARDEGALTDRQPPRGPDGSGPRTPGPPNAPGPTRSSGPIAGDRDRTRASPRDVPEGTNTRRAPAVGIPSAGAPAEATDHARPP